MLFSIGTQATAQSSLFDSVNRKRYAIAKTGFTVLGSWAAINIGAGILGQKHSSGERKQFYRANTIAGLVDMAFAGIGYFASKRMAGKPHNAVETFKKQEFAEKLFLFSVGLDIGAIAYGLYTKERANKFTGEKRDWLKAAGKALILHGAFLIAFDGILYILQAKNGSRLHRTLQNLSLQTNENGFGVSYRF